MDVYTLINNLIEGTINTFVGHYPTNQTDENGQEVPKVYPYAEINFPNILPNNTYSDKNLLTIDIWDNKDTDIREIEALSVAIHKIINRTQYNDVDMNVSINRDVPYKLDITDPGPYLQRRQLRYLATVYYKN